ncbi:MAG: sulfatase-like hydrolase/transferase, partial [Candidatus Pacebacteria bacterium]|nr:sulfatase-like hydrolase/transferase [Candidatus Paceibacterota bacterium]
ADAMGWSGGWVRTPNLDRMGAGGGRFTSAVTNTPVCIPARVSQVTGHYPHNTHIWDNFRHDLPAETRTWWQAIRNAGYRTSIFGKTHLHHHSGDLRDREHLVHAYGMDDVNEIGGPRASARCASHMTERWEKLNLWRKYKDDYAERFRSKPYVAHPSALPLTEYADVYVGQQAKNYLQNYDRDQPWFCHVSFGGPHEPWDAPEPYASMYRPEDMPIPIASHETLHGDELSGLIGRKLARAAQNPPIPSPKDIAAMRANYAGNVTLIDDQIGEILEVIEQRGELHNTVIAFSSDHGEMNGDHGLIYKGHFLNGALRVPLLMRTPTTAAEKPVTDKTCDSPVEWFDIGPTLVELADGKLEHQQFAKSLCPMLEDPNREHRAFAVSEISGEVMLMDRQWKLMFNCRGEPYLLFDQLNDPRETVNSLDKPQNRELVNRMTEALLAHFIQTQVDLSSKRDEAVGARS